MALIDGSLGSTVTSWLARRSGDMEGTVKGPALLIRCRLVSWPRFLPPVCPRTIEYLLEFNTLPAAIIFWSLVLVTSTTVLFMKHYEDHRKRPKAGIYDIWWQDRTSLETGPFAKISRCAEQLFSHTAVGLGSTKQVESLSNCKRVERDLCATTEAFHFRVESSRKEVSHRSKTSKDILQLLTTAAEALEALPEELISRLNEVLHEANNRTADFLITLHNENMLESEAWETAPEPRATA